MPLTSSASRLLAPRQIEYTNLEVFLSLLYRKHRGGDTSALLFNSGYHANTGLIASIAGGGNTMILADKLVHASIIDGIILSRAPFRRFRHNDFNHLEQLLHENASQHRNILVIVESVYSMDGDKADIERLLRLKKEYPNILLYVDEAHAFGVIGPKGLGLAAASSAPGEVDIIVGTFGKAAASMGAFAIVHARLPREHCPKFHFFHSHPTYAGCLDTVLSRQPDSERQPQGTPGTPWPATSNSII